MDLQNNAPFSSYEYVAKFFHRALLLYLVVSSAVERYLLVAARVRRELQKALLMQQPLILDLYFWHLFS